MTPTSPSKTKILSIILAIGSGLSAILLAATNQITWPAALTILAGSLSLLGIHVDLPNTGSSN